MAWITLAAEWKQNVIVYWFTLCTITFSNSVLFTLSCIFQIIVKLIAFRLKFFTHKFEVSFVLITWGMEIILFYTYVCRCLMLLWYWNHLFWTLPLCKLACLLCVLTVCVCVLCVLFCVCLCVCVFCVCVCVFCVCMCVCVCVYVYMCVCLAAIKHDPWICLMSRVYTMDANHTSNCVCTQIHTYINVTLNCNEDVTVQSTVAK